MKNKILLWYWNLVYREMYFSKNELGVRWSRLKIKNLKKNIADKSHNKISISKESRYPDSNDESQGKQVNQLSNELEKNDIRKLGSRIISLEKQNKELREMLSFEERRNKKLQ